MNEAFILAVDQGTSSTKTVVFDTNGKIVAQATEPLKSYFPQPGFVEQDPLEIYQNVLTSVQFPWIWLRSRPVEFPIRERPLFSGTVQVNLFQMPLSGSAKGR